MAIPKQERQDVRLLKRKQTRWERRQITVEGEKAILELLKSTWITERIYFTAGRELSGRLRSPCNHRPAWWKSAPKTWS